MEPKMEAYRTWAQTLEQTFISFWDTSIRFLPDLLGAILLLAIGWIIARLARAAIRRLGRKLGELAATWLERAGIAHTAPWPLDRALAGAAFWLIILFFITAAADVLGLPAIAEWLGRVMGFLPQLAAGLVIILLGYGLSRSVGEAVAGAASRARIAQSAALGTTARVLFISVVALIGVEQLGLDIALLINLMTIIIAATVGALSLAFGVGAGPAVRDIVASRHVRRTYRVGQRIKVGEIEGEVLELTSTAVVLDTREGRTSVPAHVFGEQASVLMTRDDDAV